MHTNTFYFIVVRVNTNRTMNFDLISGYSARISWSTELKVKTVECFSEGFNTVSKCEGDDMSVVVINLTQDTLYTIKLTASDGSSAIEQFSTCPFDSPRLENLYESTRRSDGVYDTTQFNKVTHDALLDSFSKIVGSGDKILAPVSLTGIKKDLLTTAVTEGKTLDVFDHSSLLLPFSENKYGMQAVTLRDGSEESTLSYDASCNSVAYGGSMYESWRHIPNVR